MPQNPMLLYAKDGGTPTYMWSVDAAEAVRLGDYTPAPPSKEGASPEERASAMSRFKTGQAMTHPELQTEEEREKTRQEANEKAELLAGVPEGAQVVVMAPGKGEGAASSRASSAGAQRGAPASASGAPASPPAGQTRRE